MSGHPSRANLKRLAELNVRPKPGDVWPGEPGFVHPTGLCPCCRLPLSEAQALNDLVSEGSIFSGGKHAVRRES